MSDSKEQGGFTWHKVEPKRGYRRAIPASKTEVWGTPGWLFRQLDDEFDFTVDVAALPSNAKCERYYTPDDNGLDQSWAGERVWCNPPYDTRNLTLFTMKALYEAKHHGAVVVLLVPSKTEQAWWHDGAMKGEIRCIRGRVSFDGGEGNAPMPVCVVVLGRDYPPVPPVTLKQPQTSILDRIEGDDE